MRKIKELYEKVCHWINYRNRPTITFNLEDNPAQFIRVFKASYKEHGEETAFLNELCKHYNCKFCLNSKKEFVLDFKDPKLYTMFMLRYAEYL